MSVLRRPAIQMAFEGVEAVRPELAIGGQPGVDLRERLGPQHVQPALRLRPDGDQAGVPQHAQVLGRARLAAPEQTYELTDRPGRLAQEIQDSAPRGLADHVERAGHPPKITM